MRISLTIVALTVLVTGCIQKGDRGQIGKLERAKDNIERGDSVGVLRSKEKDQVDLELNPFEQLPDEIDGCGCYLFLSKEDEKTAKYVFVDVPGYPAIIRVNNSIERLDQIKHEENSDIYIYTNVRFKLTLQFTRREATSSESYSVTGILLLSNKLGSIQRNVVGTCGC